MTIREPDAPPVGVRGRVVETSPEKLVLYVPGGGYLATVVLLVAVAWLVFAGVCSVWAANQIQQGANHDRFFRPGLWIWGIGIFGFCCAFKFKFERTFVMLDRKRLVIQYVLLGIKRRRETILVPSSRAELLTPRERGVMLDGVKVMGRNQTARFGNAMAFLENAWLIENINGFLRNTTAAAERSEQLGQLDPEDLPSDGNVVVDASSPHFLRLHHQPRRDDESAAMDAGRLGCLVAIYWLFIVPVILMIILAGFPVGGLVLGRWIMLLVGFGLAFHGAALFAWNLAFGRTTVSLTQTTLDCRKHLFGLNLSRRKSVATSTITSVRVERNGGVERPASRTPSGLRGMLAAFWAKPDRWSVVISGDESVVMPGFASEEDARRVAALLQTRLHEWRTALAENAGRNAAFVYDDMADASRPWWPRLLMHLGFAAAALGSLYVIDPLLLWVVPPTILFVLAKRSVRHFSGMAKWTPLATTAVTGLVAAWFVIAIVPFSWTTWPIRYAGGRVDPVGKRMFPPLAGVLSICSVTFQGTGITDRDLELVRPALLPMSNMEMLDLSETQISDDVLKHLAGLTFRGIHLQGTKVTDPGLAHLKDNPQLCWLHLNNTRVTDAGMVHVKDMKELGRLHLDGTQITDAGMAELQGLRHIIRLSLANTRITDAGLAHVKSMPLYELNLGNTQVTDVGLEHLQDQKGLYRLELDNTLVTDAGLVHLEGFRRLVHLSLKNTQVTDAGIEKLRGKMPHSYLQATR